MFSLSLPLMAQSTSVHLLYLRSDVTFSAKLSLTSEIKWCNPFSFHLPVPFLVFISQQRTLLCTGAWLMNPGGKSFSLKKGGEVWAASTQMAFLPILGRQQVGMKPRILSASEVEWSISWSSEPVVFKLIYIYIFFFSQKIHKQICFWIINCHMNSSNICLIEKAPWISPFDVIISRFPWKMKKKTKKPFTHWESHYGALHSHEKLPGNQGKGWCQTLKIFYGVRWLCGNSLQS